MQVSFISALHNGLDFTREMVRSLRATCPTDIESEILLIDDASTDETPAWLAQLLQDQIRTWRMERNSGFAAANNRGAQMARGEILVFLNSDLVLLPDWLPPMLAAFARFPTAGMVGNVQLRNADQSLDHRGVRFDLLRRPYHVRSTNPLQTWRKFVCFPAVTAACCAIRREVFLQHGGFDETYRNGYEDIDLCLRLSQAGYAHYVANRSRVLHHVSASQGRFSSEDLNLRFFLDRWGWPGGGPSFRRRGLNYVGRHWLRPWRYNGPKLLLALAWLASGRPCASWERRLGVTIKYKP